MRIITRIIRLGQVIITLMFVLAAFLMIVFAAMQIWEAVFVTVERELTVRRNLVLEGITMLTVAVASLALGETILEEEVRRDVTLSAPTRVRRFMSRFFAVVIVALLIEALVGIFRFSQESPSNLLYAGIIALSAAVLLLSWGVFLKFNSIVEKLEPRSLQKVQEEEQLVRDEDRRAR